MTDTPPTEPEADEDPPGIVAICPISPDLATQIVAMTDLDWEDPDLTEAAMTTAGWHSTGDYLGDLGEKSYTPAGHLVYGDDCLAIPFAYEYWIHPDGVWTEDFWADQPGWQTLIDPPPGTFDTHLDSVVAQFTTLLGPPHHDITHEPRPELNYNWRYRAWRRGNNILVIAPGLDNHSYSQFEHAFVQIRSLPADVPFPPARDLPDFCW